MRSQTRDVLHAEASTRKPQHTRANDTHITTPPDIV